MKGKYKDIAERLAAVMGSGLQLVKAKPKYDELDKILSILTDQEVVELLKSDEMQPLLKNKNIISAYKLYLKMYRVEAFVSLACDPEQTQIWDAFKENPQKHLDYLSLDDEMGYLSANEEAQFGKEVGQVVRDLWRYQSALHFDLEKENDTEILQAMARKVTFAPANAEVEQRPKLFG